MKKKKTFISLALLGMTIGLASCGETNKFKNVRFEANVDTELVERIDNKLDEIYGPRKLASGDNLVNYLKYNQEDDVIEIRSTMFDLPEYKNKIDNQTKANFLIDEIIQVQARIMKTSAVELDEGELLSPEETKTTYETYVAIKREKQEGETLIIDPKLLGVTQVIPIDILTPLTEDELEVNTSHVSFLIMDYEKPYLKPHNEGKIWIRSSVKYNSTTKGEKDLEKLRSEVVGSYYTQASDLGSEKDQNYVLNLDVLYYENLEDAQNLENPIYPIIYDGHYVHNDLIRYIRLVDKSGNISDNIGLLYLHLSDYTPPELRKKDLAGNYTIKVTKEDLGSYEFYSYKNLDVKEVVLEKLDEVFKENEIALFDEGDGITTDITYFYHPNYETPTYKPTDMIVVDSSGQITIRLQDRNYNYSEMKIDYEVLSPKHKKGYFAYEGLYYEIIEWGVPEGHKEVSIADIEDITKLDGYDPESGMVIDWKIPTKAVLYGVEYDVTVIGSELFDGTFKDDNNDLNQKIAGVLDFRLSQIRFIEPRAFIWCPNITSIILETSNPAGLYVDHAATFIYNLPYLYIGKDVYYLGDSIGNGMNFSDIHTAMTKEQLTKLEKHKGTFSSAIGTIDDIHYECDGTDH